MPGNALEQLLTVVHERGNVSLDWLALAKIKREGWIQQISGS